MGLIKAYYLFYYKIYRFLNAANSNDLGINDWSAAAVIEVLEIFILAIIYLQIEMKHRKPLDINVSVLVVAVLVPTLINSYFFLDENKWKRYEPEFVRFSRKKNVLINIVVLLVCLGIPALLVFTFYQDSQIDWRTINHWK